MSVNKKIRLTEPQIGSEEIEAVTKVLKSGWLTEGSVTKEFETKFASTVGAKFGIAVCNCTVGLELALRAIGIGKGDEVIVPSFTHPATALAVMYSGASPVLVDVDPFTYNIDWYQLGKVVTKNTKCVIPVSWGGNPLNPRHLSEVRDKYGLAIIEDAACSLGASYGNVKTGSMADITCFSLHPRKVITTGEGGMITTDNPVYAEKMDSMKKFGEKYIDGKLTFHQLGTNYKMPNILSAIGLAQLEKLPNIISRRIELARNYNEILVRRGRKFMAPEREPLARHVYQTYAVFVPTAGERDMILQRLRADNIEVQIGTYALHLEPAFKNLGHGEHLSCSESLYHKLLALPMASSMSYEDQEYVIERMIKAGRD